LSLLAAIAAPPELREATSDRAWLEALLAAEKALATAEAMAGVIPPAAAAAIAEQCDPESFDFDELARAGRSGGNLVQPLVQALRTRVGDDASAYVHWGATSQDVMDTAAMLVARRGLRLVVAELERVSAACAALAEAHRSTPMAARTLLQQAVPTTFGLKAAGWLGGVSEATHGVVRVLSERLAVQLGGAAGTLASLGDDGTEVVTLFAAQLELPEPDLPWQTNRVRFAEIGAALAIAAGAVAKVALDVALLSQTEVREGAERAAGGSSAMPQKQNPTASTLALACARHATADAAVLIAALPQEHERAVGAWHSEWDALVNVLAYAGGAAACVAEVVEGLDVDVERMAANLRLTDGAIVSERLALVLAARLGRAEAHELLANATATGDLRSVLADELPGMDVDELLDPLEYLGSAELFVDRALAAYAGDDVESEVE
jgi:3-carboxy-cis,cis-muconate cycloisomerase